MNKPTEYLFLWKWDRPGMPDRKDKRCRILIRSHKMNSCSIEFEDGFRAVVSRNGVRKRRAGE